MKALAPKRRRLFTGKLIIRVSALKDANHAASGRFTRAVKTYVLIKIDDLPCQRTKLSLTGKWSEKYDISVKKAKEIEFIVYDRVAGKDLPVGLLWLKINDIVLEIRRRGIDLEAVESGFAKK